MLNLHTSLKERGVDRQRDDQHVVRLAIRANTVTSVRMFSLHAAPYANGANVFATTLASMAEGQGDHALPFLRAEIAVRKGAAWQ